MERSSMFAVCSALLAALVPGAAAARVQPAMLSVAIAPPVAMMTIGHPPTLHPVPEHLEVGDQVFNGSVSGFRRFLDSKRATDPQLFAQMDPHVKSLESQAAVGRQVAIAGMVLGTASLAYAAFGQKTCSEPQLTDPNFNAKMEAWGNCTSDNINTLAIFSFLGLGVMSLGGLTGWALSPGRSDLLNLVNEHNRISQEPMRLQLGYDPSHHLVSGGVSMAF